MKELSVGTRLTFAVPILGLLLLVLTWGQSPSVLTSIGLVVAHIALVIVSVIHAEAIAHRVGEPFGTLVLAIAVTAIEVSLIITLMLAEGPKSSTLARDTVFAAIMIVCNGIVGLSIILDSRKRHVVQFSEQGANALLGTVMTIATVGLVLPAFSAKNSQGESTQQQLLFSAVLAAVVYAGFIFVQTVRHRWMFLSPEALADESDDSLAHVRAHQSSREKADGLVLRIFFLIISLVGVIGLAKTLAPRIEDSVTWFGAPQSFVGVVIALLILLPESISALRAANRGEMQTSLNLSLGSALASIGMTIPAVALASIWIDGPIVFGLGAPEMVLLALTAVISMLTFGSGRATVLQGAQHLAVFSAFLFVAMTAAT